MLLQLLLALAMQTKPASIRGKVTVADTGAAIRWAVVKVQAGPASATFSATTDSNGAYEVRNLPPGNYTARAGKPGFIEKNYLKGDVSTVKLAAGQTQEGVDIQLPRSAVITGIIIDMDGDPVADAQVQAVVKAYPQGRVVWRPQNSVATNDHGEFRLYGLPAGRYYVQASKTVRNGMGTNANYASVIFPSVSRFEEAQSVVVASGEERKAVNMTLREAPTYVVSGKVLGISGGTAPGTAGFINLNPANFGAGSQGFSQVGPDGSFRIQGIAPGSYTLRGNFPSGTGIPTMQPFTRFIEVTTGNVIDLVIDPTAGGIVKGRVKADGGELPAALNVSLGMKNPANGQINGSNSTQTDAEGNFEFKRVQPGLYDVNVNQTTPTRREFFVGSMKAGDTDILTTGLTVPEGSPTVEASITMDFRPGEIAGKTLDADSNPLPGATIALFSADPKRRSPRTWRTMRSKADSTFRLFNLPPGDYYLVIWPNDDVGLALDTEVFAMLEKQIVKVTVELGGKVTQDVTLTKALRTIADTFSQ